MDVPTVTRRVAIKAEVLDNISR